MKRCKHCLCPIDYGEICEDCEKMKEEQEEQYRNEERMNDLYTIDDSGFCDGFTKQ